MDIKSVTKRINRSRVLRQSGRGEATGMSLRAYIEGTGIAGSAVPFK